jgi:hypothetical protein
VHSYGGAGPAVFDMLHSMSLWLGSTMIFRLQ